MTKYLICFPRAAMVVPDGEREAVVRDAHTVIDEAKAAGVYGHERSCLRWPSVRRQINTIR